ncbi:MAG: hypothetical protein QOF50_1472, partial [Gaiellaceae bacterium]|nr:hypothetical protein [Gaiellaceae bacterium]
VGATSVLGKQEFVALSHYRGTRHDRVTLP